MTRPIAEPLARERLRQKGQFWTPPPVARAMVAFVLHGDPENVFDPAVGEGAFLHAAHEVCPSLRLVGREIDAAPLLRSGLPPDVLAGIELRDFVLDPPPETLPAIVANPPYLRHHRLPLDAKARLHVFASAFTGLRLDGRIGYHVFFLLRALERLAPGGRLAFILPADVFEGRSAPELWRWIARRFRISGIATFAPEATPFPGVDTNAVVVFIECAEPVPTVPWLRVTALDDRFAESVHGDFAENDHVTVTNRRLSEVVRTGLSRPESNEIQELPLGTMIRAMRGIATGDNDFFLMTSRQIAERGLPPEAFLRCVGRTRQATGSEITAADLARLDADDVPTYLLSLDRDPPTDAKLAAYLRRGERLGTADRPLVRTRSPWFKMERREPPPFLFAYLGRRNQRFIRNRARVVPLTAFLCVYPRPEIPEDWVARVLADPRVTANLARVGKSYGSGAIKVEPRALERTPVPADLLERAPHALFERIREYAA